MHSKALKTVASIGLLSLVAVAAKAQDPTRVQRESKGDVAAAPTYAAVLSAVNNATPAGGKVATLAALKAEQIRLVDTKELVTSTNEAEFTAAVDKNKDALTALRAALQKNELISKAIADHPAKPTIDDVIGADIGDDGGITIFFRRKM